MNVTQVVFSADGTTALGIYIAIADGRWLEQDTNRETRFTFVETRRDEWSVYLLDESRGVELQLDLYTRKVMYNPIGQPRYQIYWITEAY